MQKRKFDELISYFNRKVADMDIDTNYKMELLGMVTALGYAHEKETEERKKGKWIYLDKDKRFFHPHIVKCSVCNNSLDMYGVNAGRGDANFCPNCGADMRDSVETARDIVHEAINNSVWSDTVDTAKMHKAVDDKYAEIRGDANADAES